MRIPRELRKASRAARKQGWRIELTRNGHLRWVPPHRHREIVYTPCTPSEYRSIRNALSALRLSGLRL